MAGLKARPSPICSQRWGDRRSSRHPLPRSLRSPHEIPSRLVGRFASTRSVNAPSLGTDASGERPRGEALATRISHGLAWMSPVDRPIQRTSSNWSLLKNMRSPPSDFAAGASSISGCFASSRLLRAQRVWSASPFATLRSEVFLTSPSRSCYAVAELRQDVSHLTR